MNDELRRLYDMKIKADEDYKAIEGGLWLDDEHSNLLHDILGIIHNKLSENDRERIIKITLRLTNLKEEIMNKFYLPLVEVLNEQIKELDS